MPSLSNTGFIFILISTLILSRPQGAFTLECFIANCSSASCVVGHNRYVVTCKENEVCMKFVSDGQSYSADSSSTSAVTKIKPSRFSRTASVARYVRLEKGCRSRSVIASQLTQKIIEDKHFCEDLSISGSFGVVYPGTRCWCWEYDRCNKGSNSLLLASDDFSRFLSLFKAIATSLLVSNYIMILH